MTVPQLEVAIDFERRRCRAEVELHRFPDYSAEHCGTAGGHSRAKSPANPAQHSHAYHGSVQLRTTTTTRAQAYRHTGKEHKETV